MGPQDSFLLLDIYSGGSLEPRLQFCADRQCFEPLEAKLSLSLWDQADIIQGLWGSQGSSLLFLPEQTADFPLGPLGKEEVLAGDLRLGQNHPCCMKLMHVFSVLLTSAYSASPCKQSSSVLTLHT